MIVNKALKESMILNNFSESLNEDIDNFLSNTNLSSSEKSLLISLIERVAIEHNDNIDNLFNDEQTSNQSFKNLSLNELNQKIQKFDNKVDEFLLIQKQHLEWSSKIAESINLIAKTINFKK